MMWAWDDYGITPAGIAVLVLVGFAILIVWVLPWLLAQSVASIPRCPDGYVLTGGGIGRFACLPGVAPIR